MSDRINEFICIGRQEIAELFYPFDENANIRHFSLLNDSMSNTGYTVITGNGKYLLKLYSNATDQVEAAMYSYLKGKINLPELYYYDGSKQRFGFSYMIIEYIEGKKLKDHIRSEGEYSCELIHAIGKMCGTLHRRTYDAQAWLDQQLSECLSIPPMQDRIVQLLNDKAGQRLKIETASTVLDYVNCNQKLFDRLNSESVLCHGDFNYGNIIVSNGEPYLIDFEFAHAESRYYDFGKFFRRKSEELQTLIGERVYRAFADGYCSAGLHELPADWLKLARLCDIPPMLSLINRDNVPLEWIPDIETDILSAISEFR